MLYCLNKIFWALPDAGGCNLLYKLAGPLRLQVISAEIGIPQLHRLAPGDVVSRSKRFRAVRTRIRAIFQDTKCKRDIYVESYPNSRRARQGC